MITPPSSPHPNSACAWLPVIHAPSRQKRRHITRFLLVYDMCGLRVRMESIFHCSPLCPPQYFNIQSMLEYMPSPALEQCKPLQQLHVTSMLCIQATTSMLKSTFSTFPRPELWKKKWRKIVAWLSMVMRAHAISAEKTLRVKRVCMVGTSSGECALRETTQK